MPSSKQDPMKGVVEMQHEMMRTFQEFLLSTQPATSLHTEGWQPPTDVYETAEVTVVRMEIPGLEQEEFQIAVDGDRLIIQGRRNDASRQERVEFRQMEVHFGPFQRVIRLSGPIDESQVRATYTRGFLEVVVPKQRAKKATRVIILKEE